MQCFYNLFFLKSICVCFCLAVNKTFLMTSTQIVSLKLVISSRELSHLAGLFFIFGSNYRSHGFTGRCLENVSPGFASNCLLLVLLNVTQGL